MMLGFRRPSSSTCHSSCWLWLSDPRAACGMLTGGQSSSACRSFHIKSKYSSRQGCSCRPPPSTPSTAQAHTHTITGAQTPRLLVPVMSLLFVLFLVLLFSPVACRAFIARGQQEPHARPVGNRRGRGSRTTDTAFVAGGALPVGTRGAGSTARGAKPRYA